MRTISRTRERTQIMRTISRSKRWVVGLAIVAALYGLSLAWVPTAAAQAYAIQNVGSDKCLQPVNGSLDGGAPIIQTTCNNNSAFQRWEFIYSTPTIFLLRNVGSGLCLDVAGVAANHQPIDQWTCTWISNERWDFTSNEGELRSRVSGTTSYCLDVPGGTSEDVGVQLYSCNHTFAQLWAFLPRSSQNFANTIGKLSGTEGLPTLP
jgi:Ricin-type beta-trefoil lectin domain